MKIESIRDLSKLIDLCRKKGVLDIAVDGVQLKLGDAPLKRNAASIEPDPSIKVEDEYTDEELMMWSAAPHG